MALSKKEQALLESLQQKAEEPGEPEFEVEWWEEDTDGNRRGGRMPWSTGKKIYGKWAPDLFADADDDADDDDGKSDGKPSQAGGATRLFQGKRGA